MSRLVETRERFCQRSGRGMAMAVHFACYDARILCAVPVNVRGDFCGNQGAGPSVEDVVSGHVTLNVPAAVRDMIVRINTPRGGQASAASAAPRTAARGRERPRTGQSEAPRYRSPSRSRASAQGTRGPARSDYRFARSCASGYDDPERLNQEVSRSRRVGQRRGGGGRNETRAGCGSDIGAAGVWRCRAPSLGGAERSRAPP